MVLSSSGVISSTFTADIIWNFLELNSKKTPGQSE
jgi:hypothetical protein